MVNILKYNQLIQKKGSLSPIYESQMSKSAQYTNLEMQMQCAIFI